MTSTCYGDYDKDTCIGCRDERECKEPKNGTLKERVVFT